MHRRIGLGIAELFLKEGANVVSDINDEIEDKVVSDLKKRSQRMFLSQRVYKLVENTVGDINLILWLITRLGLEDFGLYKRDWKGD